MLIVKIIVLFACISVLCAFQPYYCDICSNHTLCLYNVPGPSTACNSYDSTELLSNQDILELVQKINERRNFIAMGHSKILPHAANMRKIHWSAELAIIAQRWADQCDPFLNPDREDDCRDLETTKVGQNIASVVGPSSNLNVKCFVDIWFMQILDYSGTVSFYNHSKDQLTKYLTQLIWAETELIGCGKVKFYLERKHVVMERLICNFAAKGNVHGKPVYNIGYPGTQCAQNMAPDINYKGLCDYKNNRIRTQKHTSISKQNLKQSFVQNMPKNMDEEHYHPHEQGHSRLYHGYDDHIEPSPRPIDPTTYYFQRNNDGFKTYDSTTLAYIISSLNYKKYLRNPQCTRKGHQSHKDCCKNNLHYHYTRQQHCCHQSTLCCETSTFPSNPDHMCPSASTPVNKYLFTCITLSADNCNLNCKCISCQQITSPKENINFEQFHEPEQITVSDKKVNSELDDDYHSTYNMPNRDYLYSDFNPSIRRKRQQDDITLKPFWKNNELAYKRTPAVKLVKYTTLSNIKNRKNNRNVEPTKMLLLATEPITIKRTYYSEETNDEINDEVQTTEKYLSFDELMYLRKFSDNYMDYNFRRQGGRRQKDNKNSDKDKKTTKKNNQLTTTAKKAAPVKTTTTTKKTTTPTKATTVKKIVTTKATINTKTTTKTTTPGMIPFALENVSEYTANTLFERIKHCTRKLTCTWTAFTGIAEDGNRIKEFGSRTPPGYVEGCTRTSTCTRDFMDRNKMATTAIVSSTESNEANGDDDEYCERRSLNIRKRSSDIKVLPILNVTENDFQEYDCNCDTNVRSKRRKRMSSKILSYADLYYLILNNVIKTKHSTSHNTRKCPCNRATDENIFPFHIFLFLFAFYFYF